MNESDFLQGTLGRTGLRVFRLGLSATYRPGREAVLRAVDEGVNYFFCYGFDSQMTKTLRELFRTRRRELVVSTGAYNLIWGHPSLRRTLEKRLRQLGTDYLDVFLFLGVMKPAQLSDEVCAELIRLREEGKVRAVGLSTHDRKLAGRLAADGALDVLMIRYNAAHRGAETEIFPHLAAHDPALVSYTATRWGQLARRPRGWPETEPVPTAELAYRFVLSNPHVDVCLSAPSNLRQLEENLAAARKGPLSAGESELMRRFGDAVRRAGMWFWQPKEHAAPPGP
jgi:aryl-alcohol dehydrogenase-like predicted oxidoreductase